MKTPPRLHTMSFWDRAAIVLLGAAGFAFSYDALAQVALAIHARPRLSYLFPIFVDGFIAYGVRALVLLRHSGFGARLYAWTLFLAATGSSLWANALHAITLNQQTANSPGPSPLRLGDNVVGILSMLAPLALAGSVHLYIIMARTAESSVRDGSENGPGPVRDHEDGPEETPDTRCEEVPADAAPALPAASESLPALDLPGPVPDQKILVQYGPGATSLVLANKETSVTEHDAPAADGRQERSVQNDETPPDDAPAPPAPPYAEPRVHQTGHPATDSEPPAVPDENEPSQDRTPEDGWMDDLLPIAREAALTAGRISRDAIKDAVRARQAVGNDKLGELVAVLKEEQNTSPQPTAPAPTTSLW